MGEANRMAAKRRAWAKIERERLEEERRAHWRAHVRGRGARRGESSTRHKFTLYTVIVVKPALFCYV